MMKRLLAGVAPPSGSPGVPGAMMPVTVTHRRRVVCLCVGVWDKNNRTTNIC